MLTAQVKLSQLKISTIKSLFLFLYLVISFLLSNSLISAADWAYVKDRNYLEVDEQLSDQTEVQYKEPQSVLITRISTNADSLENDSEKWVKSLYYFAITRFGFADVPYNYLIDRNGNIFQGRGGYTGAIPELQNLEGTILIGYLSNGSDVTPEAENSMKIFISDLSRAYGIQRVNVYPIKTSIIKGSGFSLDDSMITSPEEDNSVVVNVDTPKLTKLVYSRDLNSQFAIGLGSILDTFKYSTQAESKLSANIKEVKIEQENIAADEKFNVLVNIENSSPFPWFLDSKYLYVSTQNGAASSFAINGEWDSFSKPTHLTETVIMPGQIFEMKFSMQSPTVPALGLIEKYNLIIDPGVVVENSNFEVLFDVTKGSGRFVKIQPTQAGVLNVRNCNYVECAVIAQVPVGNVYRVLEENNGWYKIKLIDGEGWVGSLYAKEVD